ncbi:hypothetical protein [Aggregatilinea lenta]|uniref:hypothetical protein n=1 Tax=Aggregatilinea lenta TaxID=913108 RepID=UPI000E5AF7DD|nr:hypothetical protein [Aggregatilinea lenta]
MDDPQEAQAKVQAVKRVHTAELMRKANVVGVGVGVRYRGGLHTGEIALVVMVSRKVPPAQLAPQDVIPSILDGVPVDVQEVGKLSAQS